MHDCPSCKVPLHEHETVCPSCGAAQRRRSVSKMLGPEARKPPVNIMPFVVAIMAVIIGFIVMAQESWVGKLMRGEKPPEDPMAKLTYLDARNIVESKIVEGCQQAGATCTFKWQRGGEDVDKASEGPVEVTAEADLATAEERKPIIDPYKDYFAKAQITTFTMKDPKLKATWTYNVSAPAPGATDQGAAPAPEAAPAQ